MEFGAEIRAWVASGRLGQTLYAFGAVGSTNDVAFELAQAGAAEGTLVVADRQTAGRGRGATRWESPPGTSIAMSLVLRPSGAGPRWNGLGALAIVEALARWSIDAFIKWPNDVVIDGRKVAGVLTEATWEGQQLACLVLGLGLNLGKGSAPGEARVDFPATSLETATGLRLERAEVIAAIIDAIERWLPRIDGADFLAAWDRALAFRGRRVRVQGAEGEIEGILAGLAQDGSLLLRLDSDETFRCGPESSRLRPL